MSSLRVVDAVVATVGTYVTAYLDGTGTPVRVNTISADPTPTGGEAGFALVADGITPIFIRLT